MPAATLAWFTTLLVFAVADAIWLSQMAPRVYRPIIGEILSPRLDVGAVIAFYAIYVTGIVFFAVAPALEKQSLMHAIIAGAMLGFVAYATYDLSNQATLKVWSLKLTLIDMAWGTFATSLAATIAYAVTARFT